MAKHKIIVILGPTASGKSALAVELALRFSGEIISVDSRQVYRGLDIGTGKIAKREMRGVQHHLLDVVSPKKGFSAQNFVDLARKKIFEIAERGKVPIVCGGTGFYIDALVGRVPLPNVSADPALRRKLDAQSADQLFSYLHRLDPRRAAAIDKHNKRRIIRSIEIARALGRNPKPRARNEYDVFWAGLMLAPNELRTRINKRLRERLKRGMIAEARRLHRSGLSYKRMHELGLEYRSLARFLKGEITRAELETELQYAIWHYAKRQMTYWRRNKSIHWCNPHESAAIFEVVENWKKPARLSRKYFLRISPCYPGILQCAKARCISRFDPCETPSPF